jgi:hypothetical protein
MARPHAFPVLPFLAAVALVLTALTVVRVGYEMGLFERSVPQAGQPVTFRNLPTAFRPTQVSRLPEPVIVSVVARSSSIRGGNTSTGPTLYILTDPACGSCRAQVAEVLSNIPIQSVRVVQLYWPKNPADTSGGMALELARRADILPRFTALLRAQRGDIDAAVMLQLLADAGLPMAAQRVALAEGGSDIAGLLESDIRQAKLANLPPPPQFVLQNVLIDEQVLNMARLPLYIRRMRQNEPLVQADDYWLNPGI